MMMADKVPNLQDEFLKIAQASRVGLQSLTLAGGDTRKVALLKIADALVAHQEDILKANAIDMALGKENGLSSASLDRLALSPKSIQNMADGVKTIADMPDPIGKIMDSWQRPNGLIIKRVRTAIGVIGIIFESRPNVTIDAAALCIKSGNAAILRGGSDSLNSARELGKIIADSLKSVGIDPNAIQVIQSSDRAWVGQMLGASGYLDLIIPRGGKSLTSRVMEEAKVPVLAHLEGIVHLYIHEKADLQKAVSIAVNAKMRRTGICGAAEALLIDRSIVKDFLPPIAKALMEKGCELRGEKDAIALIPAIKPATADDYGHEFLDAIMAIKIVDNLQMAIKFINQMGSHHTDSIITEDEEVAKRFLNEIDSAIVLHNASTQFADGGEFGMGAEIGIATGRMHARGPIGIEQLCCFKYHIHGQGQCRP